MVAGGDEEPAAGVQPVHLGEQSDGNQSQSDGNQWQSDGNQSQSDANQWQSEANQWQSRFTWESGEGGRGCRFVGSPEQREDGNGEEEGGGADEGDDEDEGGY